MPALHTPTSFSGSQCRWEALPPRPAPIRTSQTHKEVVSGSLSPRDAFRVSTLSLLLLVVGVNPKTLAHQGLELLLASVLSVLNFSTFCCRYHPHAAIAHFLFTYMLYIQIWRHMQHSVTQSTACRSTQRIKCISPSSQQTLRLQTSQGYLLKWLLNRILYLRQGSRSFRCLPSCLFSPLHCSFAHAKTPNHFYFTLWRLR